jgi:hypothetical protein
LAQKSDAVGLPRWVPGEKPRFCVSRGHCVDAILRLGDGKWKSHLCS